MSAAAADVKRRESDAGCARRSAIRAFLADLHAEGQSRSTAARKLAAIRTFVRYLRREGIDRLRSRRAGRYAEARSADACAPLRRRDVAHARRARRRAAARAARPRDPGAVLRVWLAIERTGRPRPGGRQPERTMVRVLGKGGKQRLVPFNTATATAIRAWLQDRERSSATVSPTCACRARAHATSARRRAAAVNRCS